MTDTPQNIHQAIHAVKSALALHGIGKDRKNNDQKYSFRGVEDVLNALSELFVTHRINVVPRIMHTQSIERATGNGKPMPASFVDAEFDLVSVDDLSLVTFKACGEGSDMSDKGTNKAMSAAFKYAMTLGFVIPTQGVLDEGDLTTPGANEPEPERRQERPEPRHQAQNPADEMTAWAEKQIAKFAAFKAPSDFTALSEVAGHANYKAAKDKIAKADKKLWDRLHAAEGAAFQRTDDVPF